MTVRSARVPMLPVAHWTTRYVRGWSAIVEPRHPARWALLHERPHALARLVRVIERPEHRLVVDQPIALVEHALHMHTRVRGRVEHLLRGLDRSGPQLVVR